MAVHAVSCDVLYFSSKNTDEEEEVFRACKNGDLETVQRLVPRVVGTEIKDFSYIELTPLHWAAW